MANPTLPLPGVHIPPFDLQPAPPGPLACYLCHRPSRACTASSLNPNGNRDRPYYRCDTCDIFLVFNDERGNLPFNPACFCGASSKSQATGVDMVVPRAVHYVCRLGGCGYYAPGLDSEGNQIVLGQEGLEWCIDHGML